MSAHSAVAHRNTVDALYALIEVLLKSLNRGRLDDIEFVSHVGNWLQSYVRTCEAIAGEIRGAAATSASSLQLATLSREWGDIQARANRLAEDYASVAQNVGIDVQQPKMHIYLPSVPNIGN
jgi:hypothetical protein